MPVIEVVHVRKAYGKTIAVDDVSLTVRAGEIFGILGRNGAGKTTTVECITGLRAPDRGSIRVLGLDPSRDRHELHERVGVQLQHCALPERLKVGEAVKLYASFYRQPADGRELLATLGLAAVEDHYFKNLSGGLAAALVRPGGADIAVRRRCLRGPRLPIGREVPRSGPVAGTPVAWPRRQPPMDGPACHKTLAAARACVRTRHGGHSAGSVGSRC
jgi:ABC-type uncharacterized transport system YnjBCD ATPase subunit